MNALFKAPAKAIKSTFAPDWRKGNPYQELLASSLEAEGVAVDFQSIPPGLLALNRICAFNKQVDIIHLHWCNDLVAPAVWASSSLKRRLRRFLLALDLVLLRLRGRKVVWTVHNRVSHESQNPEAEILTRRVIARFCTRLLVHSRSALLDIESTYRVKLAHKADVIQLGNYDGCYPSSALRSEALRTSLGLEGPCTTLLFFGAVRRYKGVLSLIESFKATTNLNLRLVIAGSPDTVELRNCIIEEARSDSRIILKLDFIDVEEVAPLFDLADVVVLPFEATLTSGSTVLAMTLGKATLLPNEAKIFDLVDEEAGTFFGSVDDLTAKMEKLEVDSLKKMGIEARRRADKLDWKSIGRRVAAVYRA